MPYSVRFKQKMIEKMTGPGAMSATALSKEVDVSQASLSRWLRDAKLGSMPKSKKPSKERGRRWSAEDKVRCFRSRAPAALEKLRCGEFNLEAVKKLTNELEEERTKRKTQEQLYQELLERVVQLEKTIGV